MTAASDPRPRSTRLVVDLVGDRVHGRVAESRFVERPFLPGGEHNMYELAFAAAALGHDVELRGWLDRPTFEMLAAGAGCRPQVDLPARRPVADDLVVVPEGWRDPLDYGWLALSPARLGLFVLAAPGLFGWPFIAESWDPPDPLTVPLDELARPEHFQAMAGLGFELMTHSPGIVSAASDAGVECALLGTGRPSWSPPPAVEKTVDVAIVLDNRWAPLAERVANDLDGLSVDRIETVRNEELISRLARARALIWPSRIEGHATIPWEARAAGCVPVALASNRFAVGLDEAHGALVVDEVSELAAAAAGLLRDQARWTAMSERGRSSAPAEVDWKVYLDRVREYLEAAAPADPGRAARAGIGGTLGSWLDERAAETQARLEAANIEVVLTVRELRAAEGRLEQLRAEMERLWERRLKRRLNKYRAVRWLAGTLRSLRRGRT
jgi:hypothetical protein